MTRTSTIGIALTFLLALITGCSDEPRQTLALNWVPEPEFGGFYAAQLNGDYEKAGLNVTIQPGGAGKPTMQMIGAGQVEFGIVSADEIIIGRARGIDVVAIFAVYQTCPQGIMAHEERGYKDLADLLTRNDPAGKLTVAMEVGLPYGKFLAEKYGLEQVKVVPYMGGVAQFLGDPWFAQQCFVFSEPITARGQGAKPQVFLIAESGYDPYTVVVAVNGKLLREKPEMVRAMRQAVAAGWKAYLDDPAPANAVMAKLNTTMDAAWFAAGAEAHRPMLESAATKEHGLGVMTVERWRALGEQLVGLGVIDTAPRAEDCFLP